jgi:acyl-CoA synthetase (AMP-forming)/AMP-acid ligase II
MKDVDFAELSDVLKEDAAPRVLFLTVSDGRQLARVFTGTGEGAARAVGAAIAQVRGLDDGFRAKWLKLDVVKSVRTVIGAMDENGRPIEGDGVSGNLCLAQPWPGQARTLLGDHQRFHDVYFSTHPGYYFTGDGCRRDEDGEYGITGRVDDVLNVSGHRMGTAEVESALVAHEAVAEAAVVGFPHEIKGTGIYAYVIVTPDYQDRDARELGEALRRQVREVIGPIAAPDHIEITVGLPKTRSGKIMRRILRQIAAGEYDALGDVSTLADPDVVERLVAAHRGS